VTSINLCCLSQVGGNRHAGFLRERAMINHGFDAVRTSLRDMARFHAESWIDRTLLKFFPGRRSHSRTRQGGCRRALEGGRERAAFHREALMRCARDSDRAIAVATATLLHGVQY